MQVLLVTGGNRLDSTEILEDIAGNWRVLATAQLPSDNALLRAASLDNNIFLFGE